MNDFSRVAVGLFAVIAAPAAVAGFAAFAPSLASARLRLVAGVLAPLFGSLAIAAVFSEPFLDWLNVSAESFQLAAGIVMLPLALRLLWSGERDTGSASSPLWRGWSLLFGPVPVVVTLSYSTRFGIARTIGAAALAVFASTLLIMISPWIVARLRRTGCSMLGRFNGALIVLLAVELIIDGVQSI